MIHRETCPPNIDLDINLLRPIDKGRYLLLSCPACGRREAFVYKGSRSLRCNRLNKCGFFCKLKNTIAAPRTISSRSGLSGAFAGVAPFTTEHGGLQRWIEPPASSTHRLGSRERTELKEPLARYCAALTNDSPAAHYLRWRRVSPELARKYEIGYAAPNQWCHFKGGRPVRQWLFGHLVFPLQNARGELVNLQARALDSRGVARKMGLSHDLLPGPKGLFNGQLFQHARTVFLCEGVLDALSLMQMGFSNVVATIGFGSIPWRWFRRLEKLVICFDLDAAGELQYCQVARDAGLSGVHVLRLPSAIYGNKKDLNEALRSNAFCSLALFDFCEKYVWHNFRKAL